MSDPIGATPPLVDTTLIEGAAWWVSNEDWPRVRAWLRVHLGGVREQFSLGNYLAFRVNGAYRVLVIRDREAADDFAWWEGGGSVP